MDNLVLIAVARAIAADFDRAVLRRVRAEPGQRLRLGFARDGKSRSLIVSLRPELPWIGRPHGPARPQERGGAFAAACERELADRPLEIVEKHPSDRVLALRFAGGRGLAVELATHGANLVLLDAGDRIQASVRRPKRSAARLAPGERYAPPPLPGHLLDPFSASRDDLAAFLGRKQAEGETVFEAVRRHLFGVGTEGARLVTEASAASGRPVADELQTALDRLRRGETTPVVETAVDPLAAAEAGRLDTERIRLLPWAPPGDPSPGWSRLELDDASATAGLYHEALDRQAFVVERRAVLESLLGREIERLDQARARAERDREAFSDPERHRRHGEALLAGLSQATRHGDHVAVPDPYDPEGGELHIPVDPGRSLAQAAEACFTRHRRAQRGLERARQRVTSLGARLDSLRRISVAADGEGGSVEALEHALREAGIPVALAPATRARRAAAAWARPRLEGVRLLTSRDGLRMLVGKSGRDNHRLTFHLAGPEDFWFHAQGRAGAHVVVKNDTRRRRPPEATLLEAAALAAWFSQARREARVDVQWTRRKYVRRARGAPPGAVLLKRFETVQVQPSPPADEPGP